MQSRPSSPKFDSPVLVDCHIYEFLLQSFNIGQGNKPISLYNFMFWHNKLVLWQICELFVFSRENY